MYTTRVPRFSVTLLLAALPPTALGWTLRTESRDAWVSPSVLCAANVTAEACAQSLAHSDNFLGVQLAVLWQSPLTTFNGFSVFAASFGGGANNCRYSLSRSAPLLLSFDGPKWVCGLLELVPPCVVYSFGSNNNFAFEEHVLAVNHHCDVFVFDPTSDPPPDSSPLSRNQRLVFNRTGLCPPGRTSFTVGNKTLPCGSLAQLMTDRGHSHIDVLKIDVDTAEWDVVLQNDWAGRGGQSNASSGDVHHAIRVGQLLLELHAYGRGNLPVGRVVTEFMQPLEREAGLLPWFLEPVCQGCPGQLEVGFIHPQWQPGNPMSSRFRPKLAIALDLPADAASNDTHLVSWMRSLRHRGCQEDVMLVAPAASLATSAQQLVMLASQLGVRAVAPLSQLDVDTLPPAGRAFLGDVDAALREYDHVLFLGHTHWAAPEGANHTEAPPDVADRLLAACAKDAAVCSDAAAPRDVCLARARRLGRRADDAPWAWPCVPGTAVVKA